MRRKIEIFIESGPDAQYVFDRVNDFINQFDSSIVNAYDEKEGRDIGICHIFGKKSNY